MASLNVIYPPDKSLNDEQKARYFELLNNMHQADAFIYNELVKLNNQVEKLTESLKK